MTSLENLGLVPEALTNTFIKVVTIIIITIKNHTKREVEVILGGDLIIRSKRDIDMVALILLKEGGIENMDTEGDHTAEEEGE
jgi:hypothetical protein